VSRPLVFYKRIPRQLAEVALRVERIAFSESLPAPQGELRSNAAAQARQTAGARHERTLFAVACSRLFGLVPVPGELEERFLRPSLTS
jgi:hypothetical protein